MLASLGLTRDSSECALLPQGMDKPLAPRRKRKREESVEGNIKSNTVQRRSKRLQNIQNGVTISATLIEQDVIVKKETSSLQVQRRMQDKKSGIVVSNELNYGTHIGKVLKESDFDVSKVVDKWDKNKIHQHLTLSKSHRTVVTTGCAGTVKAFAITPSEGSLIYWLLCQVMEGSLLVIRRLLLFGKLVRVIIPKGKVKAR